MTKVDQSEGIAFGKRVTLWAVPFIVATIATVAPYPEMLRGAWLFPIGLLGLAHPDPRNLMTTEVIVAGWLLYVGLSIYGLLQRQRRKYLILFGILCVLLLINVVGCHVEIANVNVVDPASP